MARAKEDMDHETYLKCLEVAERFVDDGTQRELNLAGIGESTMHPRFVEYVHLAREAVGWDCDLVLSTNGVAVTEEMVKGIAKTDIKVWVSPHRPEKAELAIRMFLKYDILEGINQGAWTSSMDWAGQLDWPVTALSTGTPCPWVPNGRATVLSDGRISTCCFDSTGEGVVGHIDDLIQDESLYVAPYRLCDACHHVMD